MQISATNNTVSAASNYSISFNRALNSQGQVITPSTLSSSYLITLVFDSAYLLAANLSIQPTPSAINTNSQIVTFSLNQNISSITISSITNPLPSLNAFPITINFYNVGNSTVVDSGSASLTFQPQTFSSTALSYSFQPGNVTTTSNMTLTLVPWIWSASRMALEINLMLYWSRSGVNVSSTQILTTMSYCSPSCAIKNMGTFFLLTVSNLTLNNSALSLTIFNMLSPPTLELADTLSLSLV